MFEPGRRFQRGDEPERCRRGEPEVSEGSGARLHVPAVVAVAVSAGVAHREPGPVRPDRRCRLAVHTREPVRPAERAGDHERGLLRDRLEKEDAAAPVPPQRRRRPPDELGAADERRVHDPEHGLPVCQRERDAVKDDLHAAHAEPRAVPEPPHDDPLAERRVLPTRHERARQPAQRHVDPRPGLRRPRHRPALLHGHAERRRRHAARASCGLDPHVRELHGERVLSLPECRRGEAEEEAGGSERAAHGSKAERGVPTDDGTRGGVPAYRGTSASNSSPKSGVQAGVSAASGSKANA